MGVQNDVVQEGPSAKRPRMEDSDWPIKKSEYASKVLKDIYLDEKTADVHFICGIENERIGAHKNVLSKSSPVFDAWFYGSLACDKRLPETPSHVFKIFLKFCYSDEVTFNPNTITEVMELLHEYQMNDSLKLCGECWADHMTIEDVCRAYHWAIHFEMAEFKEFCERKISAHPLLVFETSGFRSCEHTVIDHILQLDTILCEEWLVLKAALNWAKNACERDKLDENDMNNMRKYLKDSLYRIRFKSMKLDQFREIMDSKDELFTDAEDYEEIIRLLSTVTNLKTNRFNANRRLKSFSWNEKRVLECNLWSAEKLRRQLESNFATTTTITSKNRAILLGGFFCSPVFRYNDYYNPAHISITITQCQGNSSKDIFTSPNMQIISEEELYIDLTTNPIVIRPEYRYSIRYACNSNYQIFYNNFTFDPEIKLDKETTIKVETVQGDAIIKRFKFNLL